MSLKHQRAPEKGGDHHVCVLLDREVHALGHLLGKAWGRDLLYTLIFEVGCLVESTFDKAIKHGETAALHQAFGEGRKELPRLLLTEAQEHYPEQAALMINERFNRFAKTTGDSQ